MFWKHAMKYPALIAGIIMFAIFAMDPKTKAWWAKVQGRHIPSTCRALADRIEPKAPSEWSLECPEVSKLLLKIQFKANAKDLTELRTAVYRGFANNLKTFSAMANPETLQNLATMEILILHDQIEVWGITDGQAMVDLRELSDQQKIAEHLELTVKVKEKRK